MAERPESTERDELTDSSARLIHEVNMLLSSVASHGPAALTDTHDPQYTTRLLRRLRDCVNPTPAQRLAAVSAVRTQMAHHGLDAHRTVYGREIASVLAEAALDAATHAGARR